MDTVVEAAWSRYVAGVEKTTQAARHRAIRCTLVVAPEEYPDNRRLVEVLDALMSERIVNGEQPCRVIADELALAFHPRYQGGELQSRVFTGQVAVIRRHKSRAEFSLMGESNDGRELWLTVQRIHGQYTLVRTHYFSGETVSVSDTPPRYRSPCERSSSPLSAEWSQIGRMPPRTNSGARAACHFLL